MGNTIDNSILRKVYLFTEMSDDDLEKVKSFVHKKKFNKGEIVFFESEMFGGPYVVLEGAVKIYKVSAEGREQILTILTPYNSFAEVPLFEKFADETKELTYPANAMVMEDYTELLYISGDRLYNFFRNDVKLCMKMLSSLAKKNRQLNFQIENLTLKDVVKRVAGYILSEYKKAGSEKIETEISRHDIAALLGTIPETLSRTLKKLQEENVIEVTGKSFLIKNPMKLKKMAE